MKGHELPGINQRGYKSKINEGKPGAPKTGAFIFDVDEEGNETSRRATYADTRAAEKAGKKVNYTNKEEAKRTKEEVEKYKKEAKEASATGDDKTASGKLALAEGETKMHKFRQANVRKNKTSEKEQQERKDDAAFQAKIERDAIVEAKKKKGEKTNTKALTRDQRTIVKRKKDTNKPGEGGTTYFG